MAKIKIAAVCALAGLFCLGFCEYASGIDFKASGVWEMTFDYGMNGMFTGGNGMTGYNRSQDEFEARQRARIGLEAIASESLSATVNFEIGAQVWGKAATNSGGAALGADSTNVIKLRHAWLDWVVPETGLKIRMGIQPFALPSFTTQTQVFQDDVAAITANYAINNNVSLTAFWLRPFNDNFVDVKNSGNSGFLDNMDIFGLVLPMSFNNLKVSVWGLYAAIGPNTFRSTDPDGWLGNFPGVSAANVRAGLFPAGGARHENGTSASRPIGQYGNGLWAGLTGKLDLLEPLAIAWDFNYGSVNWGDNERLDRSGWLGSLLLEYKLDWAIPGIYGWYASGDDDNPANGSERLPAVSAINANNQFSNFAFTGQKLFHGGREGLIGYTMAGTWGIGARLKDMKFFDDLKHTLRVNFIGGTNSPSMAKKISNNFGTLYVHGPNTNSWGAPLGMDPLYMTSYDKALEFGMSNSWQVYENFEITFEADYIMPWLDQSKSVWGNSKMNGRSDEVRDPWNLNVSFLYSF